MAAADYPPWDKQNPEEQEIIRISTNELPQRVQKLLIEKRPLLMDIIDPTMIWPHLRSLYAVDSRELEEMKFNAIRHVQVERLLDHLERGPAWRFHALLRACALTNQEHVVRLLGFDPQVYMAEQEDDKSVYQSSGQSTDEVRLSGRLLRAVRDHSRACRRKLMRTKLFDFDSDVRAEVLNLSEYFIQIDLQKKTTTRQNKGELQVIPENTILRTFHEDESPQAARLDGAPGAGKTTFLKHLVHKWSTEILALTGDPVILDTEKEGTFSTMVYLHVRSIGGSVTAAIRNALWCKEEDKDILMNHIENGKGVAVLIDAIDELHNEEVLKDLKEYMDEKVGGCQQILVSSRTDLCRIEPDTFDRILFLQGFSLDQALDYVKSYFPLGPSLSQPHPTLTYIKDHQQKLEPILKNPLQLHILCELTSKGLLELPPDGNLDILSLFWPLEMHLLRREVEKTCQQEAANIESRQEVTDKHAKYFYYMCFCGILKGWSGFTEEELDSFKINKIYKDAFLTLHSERGLDAKSKTFYRFGHQMLYEYFAASYIQAESEDSLKPQLLAICRKKSSRNVQKIMCEILSRRDLHKENLLQGIIWAILILQHEHGTTGHEVAEVTNLQKSLASMAFQHLEKLSFEEAQLKEANSMWEWLRKIFQNQSHKLREAGWFIDFWENGTFAHVIDCLQSFPLLLQAEITQCSVHRLLPCTYDIEGHDAQHIVYAAGPTRWGEVKKNENGNISKVWGWCPEDIVEMLQAHAERYPEYAWTDDVYLYLYWYQYRDLWGEPTENCWSQQAWDGLLRLLPKRRTGEALSLWLSPSAPLRGLVACLAPEQVSGDALIAVHWGQADSDELQGWTETWRTVGRLEFHNTCILLKEEGSDETELRRNSTIVDPSFID